MLLHRAGVVALLVAAGFAAQARAQDPVLLKYKFNKGETLIYRTKQRMDQKQTLTVMGNTIDFDNFTDQEAYSLQTVDGVDSEGNGTINVKFDRRKLSAKIGTEGQFEFDSRTSARDTSTVLAAELTPLMERLTGSEYQLVMTPRGAVSQVKGFAELVGDLVKDKQFAGQFASGDNKTAAFQEQDAYVLLSDKPVKPGDKWEVPYDVEIPMTGTVRGKNVYTYEGPDKVGDRPTARIGVNSEMSFDLKIESAATKVTGTLTGNNVTQTVQFDPAAGRVLSAKQKMSISGQLTVDASGLLIPVSNQQDHVNTWDLVPKLPD